MMSKMNPLRSLNALENLYTLIKQLQLQWRIGKIKNYHMKKTISALQQIMGLTNVDVRKVQSAIDIVQQNFKSGNFSYIPISKSACRIIVTVLQNSSKLLKDYISTLFGNHWLLPDWMKTVQSLAMEIFKHENITMIEFIPDKRSIVLYLDTVIYPENKQVMRMLFHSACTKQRLIMGKISLKTTCEAPVPTSSLQLECCRTTICGGLPLGNHNPTDKDIMSRVPSGTIGAIVCLQKDQEMEEEDEDDEEKEWKEVEEEEELKDDEESSCVVLGVITAHHNIDSNLTANTPEYDFNAIYKDQNERYCSVVVQ